MATSITLNGITYSVPGTGESRTWGPSLTNYLVALSTVTLQKSGGAFALTADANFGASKGLISLYYKSYTANLAGNISTTGVVRLGNAETIAWRNQANTANKALTVNTSDRLEFDGVDVPTISSTDNLTNKTLTSPTLVTPALGNVASGNIANTTGYAMGSLTGLGTNVASFLGTPSSANLAGALTDKTGTGVNVFATAPTLDKPVINQADVTQGASATTPAAGKSAIYVNSGDSKLHVVDSSGNDVAVGSGSSGRNYMGDWYDSAKDIGTVTNSLGDTLSSSDRTANKTTWGSSNTSLLTIARSTNSELRQTYNYLITEAGSSSGAFIESPLFTLDQVDIGKPVSVSFDVKGNAADGDYQAYIVRYNASNVLQSRIVIAGNASTTSPNSAKLPTGTTTFNGFFVPDSTNTADQYALRIVSNNSSAASLRIDTIFIGPQPIRVGASINDAVSYTPSASINQGFGTITPALSYERSGERIRVFGRFTCGTLAASEARLALPDNLTVKITQSNSLVVGRWWQDSNTGGTVKTGTIVATNGQAYVKFGIDDYTNGLYPESARLGTGVASGSGQAITVDFSTPITSWSSNQTQADRSVEEYLFNTGSVTTAGGSDTTSFGYGPNGTPCNVFASSTGSSLSTTLRVRATQPIQQTDTIVAEVKLTGQDPWYPVYTSGAILPATLQAGTVYGMSLTRVSGSNTDIDVGFGNGGRVTNGGTYGSAGAAWSASYLWRVRIIRAGAQVGYPILSSNIAGRQDGNAPATGMVGERISATITTTALTGSEADVTGASLPLTPGVWEIKYSVNMAISTGTTIDAVTYGSVVITNSSNTEIGSSYRTHSGRTIVAGKAFASRGCLAASEVVNITANTTYKLRCARSDDVVAGSASLDNTGISKSNFYAIRIA